MNRLWTCILAVVLPLLLGCPLPTNPPPQDGSGTVFEVGGARFVVEPVVSGLEVPWALGFSPDGARLFVTERPGRLRAVDLATGDTLVTGSIPEVVPPFPRLEYGLMGLAVSPSFDADQTLYVSYTTPEGLGFKNVIDRFRLAGDRFERVDEAPIVDDLPASFVHDGLPLRFGLDGMLYASTGEATQAARAQELGFLGGKFLRIAPDGSIPEGNPFGESLVWSRGHRNPQGFDFHPDLPDVLISTEHGSSAGIDGTGGEDEINRILPGRNYGWPEFRRDQAAPGFEPPLWHSGDEPIAPAGGTFCTGRRYPTWKNAFLFVGLRGASLWVVRLAEDDPGRIDSITRGLQDTFGRLRAVAEGPDGYVYMTTSNRDSRGTPGPEDDRILRLVPAEERTE